MFPRNMGVQAAGPSESESPTNCLWVDINGNIKRVQNGAPQCFHADWRLEHKESMSAIVVSVGCFAIPTKVLGAEGTAIPLSDNASHVQVAKRRGMHQPAKIG
jgi:hypothetical protein